MFEVAVSPSSMLPVKVMMHLIHQMVENDRILMALVGDQLGN
jgi:hypothetical protein